MIDTLAQPIANRTQPPATNRQFGESRGEDVAQHFLHRRRRLVLVIERVASLRPDIGQCIDLDQVEVCILVANGLCDVAERRHQIPDRPRLRPRPVLARREYPGTDHRDPILGLRTQAAAAGDRH